MRTKQYFTSHSKHHIMGQLIVALFTAVLLLFGEMSFDVYAEDIEEPTKNITFEEEALYEAIKYDLSTSSTEHEFTDLGDNTIQMTLAEIDKVTALDFSLKEGTTLSGIEAFTNLQNLYVFGADLTGEHSLDALNTLLTYGKLRWLELSSCKLTTLPSNFDYSSLNLLNLYSNELTDLSFFENGTFKNLTKLNLSWNHNLVDVSAINGTNLPKLSVLALDWTRIEKGDFDSTLVTLPSLSRLSLAQNHLTVDSLTDILNLTDLTYLNLGGRATQSFTVQTSSSGSLAYNEITSLQPFIDLMNNGTRIECYHLSILDFAGCETNENADLRELIYKIDSYAAGDTIDLSALSDEKTALAVLKRTLDSDDVLYSANYELEGCTLSDGKLTFDNSDEEYTAIITIKEGILERTEFHFNLKAGQEPTPEPVDPEPTPEPVDPEPTPEPVDPEPTPEPVDPKPTPEPIVQEPTPNPVTPEPTTVTPNVSQTNTQVSPKTGDNADSIWLSIAGMILAAGICSVTFLQKKTSKEN